MVLRIEKTIRARQIRRAAGKQPNRYNDAVLVLTFLLDHEDLIIDLLAQQNGVQIVEEGLQMLQTVAEWNDYGNSIPGDAIRWSTSATRLHLRK